MSPISQILVALALGSLIHAATRLALSVIRNEPEYKQLICYIFAVVPAWIIVHNIPWGS